MISVLLGCNTGTLVTIAGNDRMDPKIETASVLGAWIIKLQIKVAKFFLIIKREKSNDDYIEILTAQYDVCGVNIVQNQQTRTRQVQAEKSRSSVLHKCVKYLCVIAGDSIVNGSIEEGQVRFW